MTDLAAHVVDRVIPRVAADGGELRFHKLPAPSDSEFRVLLATVRRRVLRHLRRHGWLEATDGDADPVADDNPVLAACYRGSIARRQALGPKPGAPLSRVGTERDKRWVERPLGPLQAHIEGFDLHARLTIATDEAGGVTRLEKLVRYRARPPLSHERLRLREDGRVLLQLKTPWSDGTTHLAYDPLDFLAKLAALIPRPHKNLVLYHGLLAARWHLRAAVVAYRREAAPQQDGDEPSQDPHSRRAWAADEACVWVRSARVRAVWRQDGVLELCHEPRCDRQNPCASGAAGLNSASVGGRAAREVGVVDGAVCARGPRKG